MVIEPFRDFEVVCINRVVLIVVLTFFDYLVHVLLPGLRSIILFCLKRSCCRRFWLGVCIVKLKNNRRLGLCRVLIYKQINMAVSADQRTVGLLGGISSCLGSKSRNSRGVIA